MGCIAFHPPPSFFFFAIAKWSQLFFYTGQFSKFVNFAYFMDQAHITSYVCLVIVIIVFIYYQVFCAKWYLTLTNLFLNNQLFLNSNLFLNDCYFFSFCSWTYRSWGNKANILYSENLLLKAEFFSRFRKCLNEQTDLYTCM